MGLDVMCTKAIRPPHYRPPPVPARIIQITGAATSQGTTGNYRDAPTVVTSERMGVS